MKYNIETNCKLSSGMLYEMDGIYDDGQKVLCTTACPCDANKNAWTTAAQTNMVTSPMG